MLTHFRPQALIALAGVALLLVLFASVGSSFPAPTATIGGTYVEAMVGAPRYVNPLLAVSDTDRDLAHLLFSGLTRIDSSGKLVPDLASGWQTSLDARVYTFTLKPDLRWHDGQPITADDLLFTLSLLRSPDFRGDPTLADPWRQATIDAPTPQLVKITLPEPDATFAGYATLGILPRHLWGETKAADMPTSPLNLAPTGSGLWRFTRNATPLDETGVSASQPTPGPGADVEGVILEPNPYITNTSGLISRIWFRPYPGFGAALTGFRLGEAHGLAHIPPDRMAEVEAVRGVTVHRRPLARYAMLILNLNFPIFDKPEARHAIELAINRESLISGPLAGQAMPAYSPILRHNSAYNPSDPAPTYNPEEARRLLDAAGWRMPPNGIRAREGVTMTVVLVANQEQPSNVAVAKSVQASLRDIGVDVQLALVSRNTFLHDYLGPRAFHIALAGWEAQSADPDLFPYWHSSRANITGGLNFSGWRNPQADAALQQVRANPDPAARKEAYITFQKTFAADLPAVVLYTPLYTYATRAPAHNVTLSQTDLLTPAQRFDTFPAWILGP